MNVSWEDVTRWRVPYLYITVNSSKKKDVASSVDLHFFE